jgi:hypothetical protein
MSYIKFGFIFLDATVQGAALVLRKIASARWAVIELSAADLLLLGTPGDIPPRLESARLVSVASTKRDCILGWQMGSKV